MGSPEANRAIQRYRAAITRELRDHVVRVQRRMITERLSGSGRVSLASRTGALRGSLSGGVAGAGAPIQRVFMGIGGGVPYARIHERGGTITAKRVKNLAIPLPPARTAAGVKRVLSPRMWPKPLQAITAKSGKKFLIEARTKRVQSLGFNFMGTKNRRDVRVRERKTFQIRLPGGGRLAVRNEIVKAIFVLQPSVTLPARLGFKQVFREEGQETFRRIRALKSSFLV